MTIEDVQFIEVEFGTPAFDACLDLRNRVLRIPLDLEFEIKDILKEVDEFHFGLFSLSHALVACMTLKPVNSEIVKMRQVAVDFQYQGKGFGKKLILETEKWLVKNNYRQIILNARDVAIPFYEKAAYEKVGKEFKEVGIVHVKMKKSLQ